jgi:hypothetical protein
VPQRLAELVTAIGREQDPAVRGRAAVLLLRDLGAACTAAQAALDAAINDLRATGASDERIATLLEVPSMPRIVPATRWPRGGPAT